MTGSNKGHYEPCWVPVKGPFSPPSRQKLERYEAALKKIATQTLDEAFDEPPINIALEALEDGSD